MAERDRAAIGIDARVVVGEALIARDGERLRGEGLVQLDDVHLREAEAREREQLAYRRRRTESHDARRDARDRAGDDARAWRQSVALRRVLRCDHEGACAVIDA